MLAPLRHRRHSPADAKEQVDVVLAIYSKNSIIIKRHKRMNIFTSTGRHSLWEHLHDPQVRTGLYLWLVIAGLCVLVANAMAAG